MMLPAPRSAPLGQVISDHRAAQAAATVSTVPHACMGSPASWRPCGRKRAARSRPAAMNPSRKTVGSTRRYTSVSQALGVSMPVAE